MKKLHNQIIDNNKYDINFDIYLCDDGSTDGTSKEVLNKYPDVHIIYGNGNLYWAKGIAKATDEALKKEYEFFLMINDDVEFYDTMFMTMLDSYYSVFSPNYLVAIVGSTLSKIDNQWTYGGQLWNKKLIKERYMPIYPIPIQKCKECNMTNWNCFLIVNEMIKTIGKIDNHYEHAKADNDYSNRIINSGNKIFVANDYVGYCERNSNSGTWTDTSISLKRRIKLMQKPDGLPIKSDVYYCKKYFGIFWPLWVLKRYIWLLKSAIWRK